MQDKESERRASLTKEKSATHGARRAGEKRTEKRKSAKKEKKKGREGKKLPSASEWEE